MGIFRLLYRLFPRQFNRLVFDLQSKPPGKEKLEQAFIDSNGIKYFRYVNDFDIPLARKAELERMLAEFECGLNGKEMDMIVGAMTEALNNRHGNKFQPDLPKIGFLITEIQERRKMLLHVDILFDLAACLYIAEHENPAVFDKDLQARKVEQFKKDSTGGLYDFFYGAGIGTYVPYLKDLQSKFEAYIKESQVRMEALSRTLSPSTSKPVSTS